MDQKWSLVSPARAHRLTANFCSLGGQPMSHCIKAAAMSTHMIELGLGAMKVFQICTSLLAWRDSFEVAADGVGCCCRPVPLRVLWRWNKAFNSLPALLLLSIFLLFLRERHAFSLTLFKKTRKKTILFVWSIKTKGLNLIFLKNELEQSIQKWKNWLKTSSNADLFAVSQRISPSQCQRKLTMSAGIFYYVNEPDTTWKLMMVWALALLIGISSQLLELLCQKFFCVLLFTYYIYSFYNRVWVHRSVFKTSCTHINTVLLTSGYAEFPSSHTVWGLTDEHRPLFFFSPKNHRSDLRA